MYGRDCCLQPKRPGAAPQRPFNERQRFGDLLLIPAATILLFKQDEITGLIQTGIAP